MRSVNTPIIIKYPPTMRRKNCGNTITAIPNNILNVPNKISVAMRKENKIVLLPPDARGCTGLC